MRGCSAVRMRQTNTKNATTDTQSAPMVPAELHPASGATERASMSE